MVYFIIFLFIFLLILIFIMVIVKKSNIKLNYFSIPMLIFWSFLVFAYIGFPLIYFNFYKNNYLDEGKNFYVMWKTFFISSIVWIQFYIGIYLVAKRKNKFEFNIFKTEKIRIGRPSFIMWCILFALCNIILVYYLKHFEKLPIIVAIKHGSDWEIANLRSQMTHQFYRYGWYRSIFKDLLPFLSYIAFAEWLYYRKKKWGIVMIISFLLTFFAIIMTAEKGPWVFFVLGYFMIYYIFNNKYILFRKEFIKFSVVVIGILILIYIYIMSKNNFLEALSSILNRIFIEQLKPLYYYIKLFPETIPFLYGKTLPNLGGLLPWTPYNYTVEIMFMTLNNSSIIGSAPTAFFGELWINFGWIFIIIFPIILGEIIMLIHMYFINTKMTPNKIALMTWIALHLKDIALTGISTFIVDISLFYIIVAYILLKIKIN